MATALTEVPALVTEVLKHDDAIKELARTIMDARDVLYLGRGTSFPIAMEGALKLKEVSYIHAEGYAAGEMKHAIAPGDRWFGKTVSNLQEAAARGGRVIFLTDADGAEKVADMSRSTLILPDADPFVLPILYSIPVQLLAYHVAVLKGTDVDQPRNLAKSVTVE